MVVNIPAPWSIWVMIYLESIVNCISQQHGRNAQEAMSMNSRILSDSGRERSWQHNVRWSPWSPEAKPPSRKAFRIVQVSNVFKHSGKLSYFTNLNSSAIWGWFPLLTMISSEVAMDFCGLLVPWIEKRIWKYCKITDDLSTIPWDSPQKIMEIYRY